jgi:hypothetical protein
MRFLDHVKKAYPHTVLLPSPASAAPERARGIITAQTDTIFIDAAALLDKLIVDHLAATPAAPPVVSLNILVFLVRRHVLDLLNTRPHLLNVFFGVENLPNCPVVRRRPADDTPFSTHPDTVGCDFIFSRSPHDDPHAALFTDDVLLGRTIHTPHLLPREAVRDPYTRPVFYAEFFQRLLARLAPPRELYVTVLCPLVNMAAVQPSTRLERALHSNAVYYAVGEPPFYSMNMDATHVGDVAMQAMVVYNTLMRRALADATAEGGRAFRFEVHAAPDVLDTAACALLLEAPLAAGPGSSPFGPYDRVGTTLHMIVSAGDEGAEDDGAIFSVHGLADGLGGLATPIAARIGAWLAVYGSDYWPSLITTDMDRVELDLMHRQATDNAALRACFKVEHRAVVEVNVQRYYMWMLDCQRERVGYLSEIDLDQATSLYYGELCKLAGFEADMRMEQRSETQLNREYLMTMLEQPALTADEPYSVRNTAPPGAVRQFPFMGDIHPLTVVRRAAMVAWTLAYYMAGHTLPFSGTRRLASGSQTTGHLERLFLSDDESTAPPDGPDKLPSIVYRVAETAQLGALLEDMGLELVSDPDLMLGADYHEVVANVSEVPIYKPFATQFRLRIDLSPPLPVRSSDWRLVGMDELIDTVPLFLGVDLGIPTWDTPPLAAPASGEPGAHTLAVVRFLQDAPARLGPLAADKLVALQTLNPRWPVEFVTAFTQYLSEVGAPDVYLCLLYVYALNVARHNGFAPHYDPATRVFTPPRAADALSPEPSMWLPASLSGPLLHVQLEPGARHPFSHILFGRQHMSHTVRYPIRWTRYDAFVHTGGRVAAWLAVSQLNTRRATARTAWAALNRRSRNIALLQLSRADQSDLNVIENRLLSPVAEVCDYGLPLLRRDATPAEWDRWMHRYAAVWGEHMLISWASLIRWKIAQTIYLQSAVREALARLEGRTPAGTATGGETELMRMQRELMLTPLSGSASPSTPARRGGMRKASPPPSAAEAAAAARRVIMVTPDEQVQLATPVPDPGAEPTIATVLAARDSKVYTANMTSVTWPFAYYRYRQLDTLRVEGNEYILLKVAREGDDVIKNLSAAIPAVSGVEFSITPRAVNVFFVGWHEALVQQYIDHVFYTAVGKHMHEWTDRLVAKWQLGTSGLTFFLPEGPRSVNFYRLPPQ